MRITFLLIVTKYVLTLEMGSGVNFDPKYMQRLLFFYRLNLIALNKLEEPSIPGLKMIDRFISTGSQKKPFRWNRVNDTC